jgi:hypothetical protein
MFARTKKANLMAKPPVVGQRALHVSELAHLQLFSESEAFLKK